MWFGLTIARSRPASTQWWRKTELSTARGRGLTPKETLETPSEVFTSGISAFSRRIPSIVSTAEGFHSSSPVVRVKVSRSKISDSRVEPVLVAGDLVDPLGDLDLAVGGLRHPDLVDRQRDQRRAVFPCQRHDDVGLVAARLEVDRVDDRPAGDRLQRRLDHLGLGRVDLDRRRLGQRDPLDDGAHLVVLVLALGQRDADVEHVGAAFDLVFGDLDEAVVVVGEQQFLGFFRALRVDPLADQGRPRLLHQRGRGHHRGDLDRARGGAGGGRARVADPLADRADVFRVGAAAAADDADAVALDELAQRRRQRLGLFREDRLAVGALQRQARVGDAVDRQRRRSRRGSGSRRACPRGRSSS